MAVHRFKQNLPSGIKIVYIFDDKCSCACPTESISRTQTNKQTEENLFRERILFAVPYCGRAILSQNE